MIRPPAFCAFASRSLTGSMLAAFGLVLACALPTWAQAQSGGQSDPSKSLNPGLSSSSNDTSSTSDGDNVSATTRLRQTDNSRGLNARASDQPEPRDASGHVAPYVPNEFELYVQQQVADPTSSKIRRFGAELVTDSTSPSSIQDPLPSVPGDYIIRAGDEIALNIWGTVDADLRLTVDRAGRISVPRVGAINVAGLKNSELADTISRHVSQVFNNFQLTATLGQVRAIRIFVGGYAQRRGSITVNGLSSVLHAIMRAGGPSSAGSFRDIRLFRTGQQIAIFDLYDMLLGGKRNVDQLVQPDDTIFIGPVGTQVAMIGSVNEPAIYELKPNEVLSDVLRMAGGFDAVADRTRVAIERLADRNSGHVTELKLPADEHAVLNTGDVVRAFSTVTASLPKERQNKRVRVEGEVANPGDYVLPPGSTLNDALRLAGGMTRSAYPFATEFTRESVRREQQTNYDRALRDLETDMAKAAAGQRSTSADDVAAQTASANANARLIDRLRQIRPTGRIVLQIQPEATELPNFALEDGDDIKVPGRGTSVGVYGSVFNSGSYVFVPGHVANDFLQLAGGATRGADKGSMFLIHVNGSVVSARQGSTFWNSSNNFITEAVLPGDTIFVPEELDKSTFVQNAKDWTQILYQFGIGVAALQVLR